MHRLYKFILSCTHCTSGVAPMWTQMYSSRASKVYFVGIILSLYYKKRSRKVIACDFYEQLKW